MTYINLIGAGITAGMGLLGLLNPDAAARLTGIQPKGLLGRSEIRATYGGLFLAMGVFCLVTREPAAFAAVGAAWLGAGGGRLFSVVIDCNVEAKNLVAIAFEAIVGILHIL